MSSVGRMRTLVMLVRLLVSVTSSPVTFTPAPTLPSQISPPPSPLITALPSSRVYTEPTIPSSASSLGDGRNPRCPLEVTPDSLVVRFGYPVTANCSRSSSESLYLAWEIPQLKLIPSLTNEPFQIWKMDNMTEWDIQPMCYTISDLGGHCSVNLSVVVYKPPDSVTISLVNHTGPLLELHQYSLECSVKDVAPVENLTVTFYKGNTEVQSMRSKNLDKTPVTEIFAIKITPQKEDDGAHYWCEARLDLESKHPTVQSQKFTTEVLFGPNFLCAQKLQYKVGDKLSCEVEGNPNPSVKWLKDGQPFVPPSRLTREHAGKYTISATGPRGRRNITVELELQCGNGGLNVTNRTLLTVLLLYIYTFLSNVN